MTDRSLHGNGNLCIHTTVAIATKDVARTVAAAGGPERSVIAVGTDDAIPKDEAARVGAATVCKSTKCAAEEE